MRIKKKTFYIVLPLSILVVLLLLLFVFLMGWFGNAPKLNRYGSLIETCEVEKKLFKVLVKCDVFINKTSQKDGKNCLDLTVVNKENTNILPLEVCEKEKVLDISDPVLDTDMKVPLHMVFEYTYLPPLSYGISHISMELMDDREIIKILKDFNKKGIIIVGRVRTQEIVDIEKKRYYFAESDSRIEGNDIGEITFVQAKIKEITIIRNEILFKLAIMINDEERLIETKATKILYIEDISNPVIKEIKVFNISEIDINQSFSVKFLYIPQNGSVKIENIVSFCSNPDSNMLLPISTICDNQDTLKNRILDTNIEEYILKSFDKLMFGFLIVNV